jgi:hypothetical protein
VAALESAEGDGALRVSCRTGPLRVGRSLRDLYTGLGDGTAWGLALLGACDSKLRVDAI